MKEACANQGYELTEVRYHTDTFGNEMYLVRRAYISTKGRHVLKTKTMNGCSMKYMKYLPKEIRTMLKKTQPPNKMCLLYQKTKIMWEEI